MDHSGPVPIDPHNHENYEVLLNLAERLGDAKPKGLSKQGKNRYQIFSLKMYFYCV